MSWKGNIRDSLGKLKMNLRVSERAEVQSRQAGRNSKSVRMVRGTARFSSRKDGCVLPENFDRGSLKRIALELGHEVVARADG
jgi:hypothetical protein